MSEMTISEYDVMVFRDQQAARLERHKRSIHRWKMGAASVAAMSTATAVLGTVFMIWQANAGPSAQQVLEDRQQRACIEAHGTWIKVKDGDTSAYGTCIGDGAE